MLSLVTALLGAAVDARAIDVASPPPPPPVLYECIEGPPPQGGCVVTALPAGVTKAACDTQCHIVESPPPPSPPSPPPPPTPPKLCKKGMDLGLVLDSSCSIGPAGKPIAPAWLQEVRFAESLVAATQIDAKTVNFGLVEFAKEVSDNLNVTADPKAAAAAVTNITEKGPHTMGCETHTSQGFNHSWRMLNESARAGLVQKVVLMVTDGIPEGESAQRSLDVTDAMKAQDVKILAVGVGPKLGPKHEKFLEKLVTNATEDYFSILNFSDLTKNLAKILAQSCKNESVAERRFA
jgi:hypothetical protein